MPNLVKMLLTGAGVFCASQSGAASIVDEKSLNNPFNANYTWKGCTDSESTDYCVYVYGPDHGKPPIPNKTVEDECFKAQGCCQDNSTITHYNDGCAEENKTSSLSTKFFISETVIGFAGLVGLLCYRREQSASNKVMVSSGCIGFGSLGMVGTLIGMASSGLGVIVGGSLAGMGAGFGLGIFIHQQRAKLPEGHCLAPLGAADNQAGEGALRYQAI